MKIKKFNIFVLILLCISCLVGCSQISELKISTEYIEKNMYVGDKILLKTNAENQEEVVWETSDDLVAIVSEDGLVTALSVGEVTIIAKYGDYNSIVIINVYERTVINDIDITISGNQSVLVNETTKLIQKSKQLTSVPSISSNDSKTIVYCFSKQT